MAIVEMDKITLIALKQDRDLILHELQKLGVVEINEEVEETSNKENLSDIENVLEKTGNALSYLSKYDRRKKPLFSARREFLNRDLEKYANGRESTEEAVEIILSLEDRITSIKSRKNSLLNTIDTLNPWESMDLPVDAGSTRYISILKGVIPAISDPEELKRQLYASNEESYIKIVSQDRDQHYLYAVFHKNDTNNVTALLKRFGFTSASFKGMTGQARKISSELKNEVLKLEDELDKLSDKLAVFAGKIDDIEVLYDYLIMRKERLEASKNLILTSSTFMLRGWVPREIGSNVAKALSSSWDCYTEIIRPDDGEDFPVLLRNNAFTESVETITEMYSLPSPKEVDPNAVMAPFFILFFGLMLSDAGYGLIMALGAGLILWKFNINKGTAKFIRLMFFCGLATIFWGALFGGWFGDVVKVLSNGKFSLEPFWFNPINYPERLLMWSLAFGVFHIYVGISVKAFNLVKKKKYLDVLFDSVFWYIFFTGAVFIVLPFVPNVSGNLDSFVEAGKYMLLAGGVLLILSQGRAQKNIIMKILSGITSLYDLVGFMSDVLSYSRLLALGLATSVIATIVNQMGALAGTDNIFGLVVFAVVFLAGHTFNFLINALGAYVHSSRLQYIEFFGKFYQGGGKPFNPLKINTKYINLIQSEE